MIFYYQESDLQFTFHHSWKVIKLDEHRFYTYLSGYDLKAVDFLLYDQEQVILIEVKNFSRADQLDYLQLKEKLSGKIKDSLSIIDLVRQYYLRKWYLPLLTLLLAYFPRFKFIYFPWLHISALVSGHKVRSILLLEALTLEEKQVKSWQKELTQESSTTVDILVDVNNAALLEKICLIKKIDQGTL